MPIAASHFDTFFQWLILLASKEATYGVWRQICNQQVVGSSPTAGSLFKQHIKRGL